ncbi:MAG: zinc-binding dehydrogenase, partial [Candidatus Binatia bacterium]
VLVGLMGGVKAEVNLGLLLTKRLQVFGSVLRSRTLADKVAITQRFRTHWLPLLAAGRIKPIIDRVFPLAQAGEAHRYMEENRNFGKIILEIV